MVDSIFRAYFNAYRGLPREVWYLSAALFINRCGTMVLTFLTLYLHESIGLTKGHAAQMISIYGLGAVVGVYAAGWLTDKVGAVRLVILFLMLSVPMFLLIPFVTNLIGFSITLFFLAVFSEGVRPANGTAVAHYTPPQDQTRAFGLQRMALNLGVSFGPAIGGFLAEIDYFWIFIADGLTTFACALVLLWAFGWKYGQTSTHEEPTNESGQTTSNGNAKSKSPFRDLHFMAFLGLILLSAIVFFQFHSTYPLYLEEHFGLTKPRIGLIFAVNTIIIVLFEMLLVDYARRWELIRAIGWGCFFSSIGFGILPFSQAIWLCVFSMLIITIGEMLSMPLASGWVGLRSAGKNRGMYMAAYSLTYSIANVIAPILGGWCYGISPHLFWYISIGLGFVTLIGFYWLSQRIEQEPT